MGSGNQGQDPYEAFIRLLAQDINNPEGWLSDGLYVSAEKLQVSNGVHVCGEGSIDLGAVTELAAHTFPDHASALFDELPEQLALDANSPEGWLSDDLWENAGVVDSQAHVFGEGSIDLDAIAEAVFSIVIS